MSPIHHAGAAKGWSLSLRCRWRAAADARLRRVEAERDVAVAAALVHASGPARVALGANETATVTLVRDGARFLDAFVAHYRALGVRAMVFIDNGSTDGTLERLAALPEATVYRCPLPFLAFEVAMRRSALGRIVDGGWALVVDMDEHFASPLPEAARLPDVAGYCAARGFTAVVTQMIDLFPARDDELDDPAFIETHVWIDPEPPRERPYFAVGNRSSDDRIALHFGGARARAFGTHGLMLTKHALFRNDGSVYLKNPHYVAGARVADFSAALLHYKLAGGFAARVRAERRRADARHVENARYAARLGGLSVAAWPRRRFPGVAGLVDLGLLVTPPAPFASTPFVSVIVPLFNEAPRVEALLDALLAQDYPADRYEVLLVDNGSTDATLALCRARGDARVVVLEERAAQGPDAARNRALPVARGAVIAFTDGDCRPRRDWLAAGVAALATADLAGGEVRATTSEPPSLAELYDALTFLRHADSIARRGTAFTANLFVRRAVFAALGPFPVLAGWNGDAAFSARATARGFKLIYAPAALVEHPARAYAELAAKVRRIGRGQGVAGAPPAGRPSTRASPLRLGRWLAKPHVAHLSPFRLRQALRARGETVPLARGVLLWLLGVALLAIGLAAFAAGRSERLAPRLSLHRLKKIRV